MSGPGEGKKLLGKADVYIHEKGKSNARITHVDIELNELNEIIKPGETTYCGSKEGGVFLGLKKEMIKRAESFLTKENQRFSGPQKSKAFCGKETSERRLKKENSEKGK